MMKRDSRGLSAMTNSGKRGAAAWGTLLGGLLLSSALVAGFAVAPLVGCGGEPTDAAVQAASARPEQLVGRWSFVYAGERRRAVEADLATKITDPAALAAAQREAAEEAATSEIELTREGWFISRIAGQEIERMPYNAVPVDQATLRMSMSHGGEIHATEVDLATHEGAPAIVIRDPRKGPLTFRRVAP